MGWQVNGLCLSSFYQSAQCCKRIEGQWSSMEKESHRYFLSGKEKEWEIAKFCMGSVNGINEGGLAMNIEKVV